MGRYTAKPCNTANAWLYWVGCGYFAARCAHINLIPKLRRSTIILFFLPLIAFGQNQKKAKEKAHYDSFYEYTVKIMDRFNLDSTGYHGQLKTDTVFYDTKKVKAVGSFAIDRNGNINNYKVGKWIDYYENGQIKSIGEYQIDFVWMCSSARPALQYYSYKIGNWSYYYDNGQIMAQGTYDCKKSEVFTGIADQYAKKPFVTTQWSVYENNGQAATDREKIIKQLDSL